MRQHASRERKSTRAHKLIPYDSERRSMFAAASVYDFRSWALSRVVNAPPSGSGGELGVMRLMAGWRSSGLHVLGVPFKSAMTLPFESRRSRRARGALIVSPPRLHRVMASGRLPGVALQSFCMHCRALPLGGANTQRPRKGVLDGHPLVARFRSRRRHRREVPLPATSGRIVSRGPRYVGAMREAGSRVWSLREETPRFIMAVVGAWGPRLYAVILGCRRSI